MTEVFIRGQRVTLPRELSLTYTEENPEITNNGDFTWDVELSLKDGNNARLLGHINRLNVVVVPTSLSEVTLIIDNRVRVGKFIVLTNTDETVTVQFVAGNSELNFVAKTEKKIWELEGWGEELVLDYAIARKTLSHVGYGSYTENGSLVYNNFVCTPVQVGEEIMNNYGLTGQDPANPFCIDRVGGKIILQPYLLYYINKLPSLLGYELTTNILNNDLRAKRMYVVSSSDSRKYADALPDMTVTEFIDAIENFFNVSFIVDGQHKTIRIESLGSSISTKKTVTIKGAHDNYERSMTEESKSLRIDFTKLSYDLPDNEYFKFHKISTDILSKCIVKEFANYTELDTYLKSQTGIGDKLMLYRDLETNRDYFTYPYGQIMSTKVSFMTKRVGMTNVINTCHVNKLKSVGTDDNKELVLSIYPAAMLKSFKQLSVTYVGGGSSSYPVYYQLPICSNSYYVPLNQGFVDTITKSESSVPRNSKLEVALFAGIMHPCFGDSWPFIYYPFSYIDTLPEFELNGTGNAWLDATYKPHCEKSMRLDALIADYHQQTIVDTSKVYNFTLPEGPGVTAANLFSIRNKTYMPISLEHDVTIDGYGKTVKSKFYALK